MYDLIAAIVAKFKTDADLAQITGGMFLGRAPAGTAMPYAVIVPLGESSPDYTTGTAYTQPVALQLSVYATPLEEAARLGQLLRDKFHRQALPMDRGRCMAAEITGGMLTVEPEPDAAGNDVGHHATDFLFTQQQNHL